MHIMRAYACLKVDVVGGLVVLISGWLALVEDHGHAVVCQSEQVVQERLARARETRTHAHRHRYSMSTHYHMHNTNNGKEAVVDVLSHITR